MTAQPVFQADPDDPDESLRTWRLIALATSSPGYEDRVREAADSTSTGRRGTPIEDIVPDWAERVEAARRRMAG
ncbi:MAG TPA: hypothetical protein VIZ00_14565 [Streptosporangiaceae bacterium]